MERSAIAFLEQLVSKRMQSYEAEPGLLREHYGIEQTVLAGGYGYRQILELVQNGADAILEEAERTSNLARASRITVALRGDTLYVANTGAPLSNDGLDALLRSHSSSKRGNQIGRFGLGFKSLLRLQGEIDIFMRSGDAIRFDPGRCREELKARFNVPEAPGLRLAWPLESTTRSKDETIKQELAWAETVIRARVQEPGVLAHLQAEIEEFPAEFLLFFPVATKLELDANGKTRVLEVRSEGDEQILFDGDASARWKLVRSHVHINDPAAAADATHIHARDSVPVAWAAPLGTRRDEGGRFWAFFPTRTPTYLPGIINAPWKLNSDRNAIIGGEWNSALMREAARLIADTLPTLSSDEDPAQHLDAFPRQLERKEEDAAPLVDAVWSALASAAVVPDSQGKLRTAADLWRPPRDSAALAQAWTGLASEARRREYCHSKCFERQRASRLAALADAIKANTPDSKPRLQRRGIREWFEAVSSDETSTAKRVLSLAEAFAKESRLHEWSAARRELAIVPVEGGGTTVPSDAVLCPPGTSVPGRQSVTKDLANDDAARTILEDVLGVSAPSNELFRQTLNEALRNVRYGGTIGATAWRTLWERLRSVPLVVAREFVSTTPSICVLRSDGSWVKPQAVLLPGAVVREDDESGNRRVLLDAGFHAADAALLECLKLSDSPHGEVPATMQIAPAPWVTWCRRRYKETHTNSASWDYLVLLSGHVPSGIEFMHLLEGEANARLTTNLLRALSNPALLRVVFGHRTSNSYPTMNVPSPVLYLLAEFGHAHIGGHVVPLAAMVARRNAAALHHLHAWSLLAPLVESLARVEPTSRQPSDDELDALWKGAAAEILSESGTNSDALNALWLAAAKDGFVPDRLNVDGRDVPIEDVFVTSSPDLLRHASTVNSISVAVPEAVLPLWIGAGAKNLNDLVRPRWTSAVGPDLRVSTAFPELARFITPAAEESARCRPVSELLLSVHESLVPVPCVFWGGELLMDPQQLRRMSAEARLSTVVREVAEAGWLSMNPEEAIRGANVVRFEQLRGALAKCSTPSERLLTIVGGKREHLLTAFGEHASLAELETRSDLAVAAAALAFNGPTVLSELSTALEAEGLKPPRRWNSPEAREFVEAIGFGPEYATAPTARREAEEIVSGPIRLPALHDFQEEVFAGLSELWASHALRRRAVVSLPTGGGKTRVTVEAAVRIVLAPAGDRRCVIWIAQTDELCEQAVQAFRQVWINQGAENTPLRVVRLWGGTPTPSLQELDRPVAVVSSIQTLNSRMGTDGLNWVRGAAMVVMDECHHAITASYTNVLRWLDIAHRADQVTQSEPIIIGLSATPFRSDEDESARLARRFENRWLPPDQGSLHARLQAQGVLARIVYEPLRSTAQLLDEEVSDLSAIEGKWEGLEFENLLERINRRLGMDKMRNRLLMDFLQTCSADSILFFANSVRHAEQMAIRLNLAGISAAAVSGTTPPAARRYFLERFKAGEIRILCNQSVLTTGFDAPRTDMILIARQVFSPVHFMQMVGRGLRGEANGGTAECRLVTVLDNLGRFQDKHPYDYCRRFFEFTP